MFLLHANIISLNYRGDLNVLSNLKNKTGSELFLCSAVLAESYFGVHNSKNNNLKTLLLEYYNSISNSLVVLDFDLESAKIYAKIKFELKIKGIIVEDFDLMIAAIALSNKLTLVTANTKHFKDIDDLKVEDWSV
jgi:predicted nucleic acid-binding protein